jgi:hypothetical protein
MQAAGFIKHVLRRDYGTLQLAPATAATTGQTHRGDWEGYAARVRMLMHDFTAETLGIGLPMVVWGVWAVVEVRGLRRVGYVILTSLSLHVCLFLPLANVDVADALVRYVLRRFWPQAYMCMYALCAAAARQGMHALCECEHARCNSGFVCRGEGDSMDLAGDRNDVETDESRRVVRTRMDARSKTLEFGGNSECQNSRHYSADTHSLNDKQRACVDSEGDDSNTYSISRYTEAENSAHSTRKKSHKRSNHQLNTCTARNNTHAHRSHDDVKPSSNKQVSQSYMDESDSDTSNHRVHIRKRDQKMKHHSNRVLVKYCTCVLYACTVISLLVTCGIKRFAQMDQSDNFVVREYAESVLRGLPQGAVLLTQGDAPMYATRYLHEVMRRRLYITF